MKKSTLLAFTAAVLFGSGVFHVNAASATFDDPLLLPNPAKAPTTGSVVLVPVASPQAVQSIHEFVKAWENAEKHIALAESKKNNHQALTKEEAKWLHSKDKHNYADYFRKHSLGYVHGQETALNWNGENRNKNEYSYYTFPKYDKDQGYTNSYGYNVLRSMVDMLDIMAQDQEHVSNEELRYYMNEAVWFATKQTVKNMSAEEPSVGDMHEINLREAIQTDN
ncbi:MAG: hypothetical protein E6831_09995 [Veillonella sp.]|nr:hypothetical protein [Veillonella sp.]